jgi:hypothetical protein
LSIDVDIAVRGKHGKFIEVDAAIFGGDEK